MSACLICKGNHNYRMCPTVEQVQAMQRNAISLLTPLERAEYERYRAFEKGDHAMQRVCEAAQRELLATSGPVVSHGILTVLLPGDFKVPRMFEEGWPTAKAAVLVDVEGVPTRDFTLEDDGIHLDERVAEPTKVEVRFLK